MLKTLTILYKVGRIICYNALLVKIYVLLRLMCYLSVVYP